MASRYGRRSTAQRGVQREALHGEHWGARLAAQTPPKFEKGDRVRIKKNKQETTVSEVTDRGYLLKDFSGYFPADTIEKI